MKDTLGGKIMAELALTPKTYSYSMHDCNTDETAKGTKKCVIKRRLKFNDYKNCLVNDEIISKLQQRFKSEPHNVHTKDINKNAITSNWITTYSYQ